MTAARRSLVVEFTGVTGVGKSTLLGPVCAALGERGFRARDAHSVVRACHGVDWPKYRTLQALSLYALSLPGFVSFGGTRRGRELIRMGLTLIRRGPDPLGWRMRVARNFIKLVGVHMLLRKGGTNLSDIDFLLCDEGIIHTLHPLFVHAQRPPRPCDVEEFASLLPLPDAVVWVTAPAEQSIDVTLRRGHPRVPRHQDAARAFVAHANRTFAVLESLPQLRGRLLRLDNTHTHDDAGTAIRDRARQIADFLIERQK